jgi:rubrerythrin
MSATKAELPRTTDDAYAHINSVEKPTLLDLKVAMLLEGAGQAMYDGLAAVAPSAEVRALLAANAREELGHAERLIEVIRRIHGVEASVPPHAENPYVAPEGSIPLNRAFLAGVVTGELHGEALYERWAAALGDAECAKLLRQNGREERTHSERAQKAHDLLPA